MNMDFPELHQLLGVTYSQFDNTVGPQLLYEYPQGAISPDAFEAVSEYVIVGKHLCEKIIMVKVDNIKFLNFSVAIENSKYERNTLSFALGFVLTEEAESEPYENILRKISATLISMEMELEFLFKASTKKQLGQVLLQNIYDGLRTVGEVFVRFDDANLLSARLLRPPQPPRTIHPYDVPLLIQNKASLAVMPWDITVARIMDKIDGKISVHRIADEADIDVDCVRRCIRILLFYECVVVTDVFLFSNVYRSTSKIMDINPTVADFTASQKSNYEMMGSSLTDIQYENIFRFLLSIRPGVAIGKIIIDNLVLLKGIDIPRVIAVASHICVIERVQEYPLIKVGVVDELTKLATTIKSNVDKKPSVSAVSGGIQLKGVKGQSRTKDRSSTTNGPNATVSGSFSAKNKSADGGISSVEYFCGPCLDEIRCRRQSLNMSEKDFEILKSGPIIYK